MAQVVCQCQLGLARPIYEPANPELRQIMHYYGQRFYFCVWRRTSAWSRVYRQRATKRVSKVLMMSGVAQRRSGSVRMRLLKVEQKKKKGRKLFDSWCVGKKYGNWSERINTCTLSTVHVVIRFIRGKHRASNKNCYCNGSLQFMIIFSRNVVVNITIKIHTY